MPGQEIYTVNATNDELTAPVETFRRSLEELADEYTSLNLRHMATPLPHLRARKLSRPVVSRDSRSNPYLKNFLASVWIPDREHIDNTESQEFIVVKTSFERKLTDRERLQIFKNFSLKSQPRMDPEDPLRLAVTSKSQTVRYTEGTASRGKSETSQVMAHDIQSGAEITQRVLSAVGLCQKALSPDYVP